MNKKFLRCKRRVSRGFIREGERSLEFKLRSHDGKGFYGGKLLSIVFLSRPVLHLPFRGMRKNTVTVRALRCKVTLHVNNRCRDECPDIRTVAFEVNYEVVLQATSTDTILSLICMLAD